MSANDTKAEQMLSGFVDMVYDILKPLMNPLVDKWDQVTGDAQAVYDTAGKWRGMAETMRSVSTFEGQSAAATVDGWRGLSGNAYRESVQELADFMDEIAGQMDGVSGLLESASQQVQEAENLCQDLIYELVEWAAVSLAISAAGAVITLGASAAAGAAAAAAKAGVTGAKIANLLRKVAAALKKVKAAIEAYKAWLKGEKLVFKILWKTGVQAPIVKAITGLDANFKDPALALADTRMPGIPGQHTG